LCMHPIPHFVPATLECLTHFPFLYAQPSTTAWQMVSHVDLRLRRNS
jgi:hypothetical protein